MNLIGLESQFKALLAAVKSGKPSLLIGETGTGKTSLVYAVANHLKRAIYRINLDGGTTPDLLIGRTQLKDGATYFQEGIAVRAMREGAILYLDEINAALPDTLFAIHAVTEIDNPSLTITETGKTVKPSEGFCVVASMNPSHDYSGTKSLNHATANRFTQRIKFKSLGGESLVSALASHHPNAETKDVLTVASLLEKLIKAQSEAVINTRLSIRDGINALYYMENGLSKTDSINVSIIDKLEDSELMELKSNSISLGVSNRSLSYSTIESMLSELETLSDLKKECKRLTKKLSALEAINGLLRQIQPVAESIED